jgi:cellulase/cellobiase CelA1
VWQQLFNELKDRSFMVVAVAEDSRGHEHARPWIEKAQAEYWCLIDPEHRVASLYGMSNVPRAVWIDERNRIVRPPENAGSTDHFRNMDQNMLTMSAADQAARDAGKAAYVDAVREWVTTGRHALDAPVAREKLPRITAEIALADKPYHQPPELPGFPS